MSRSDAQLVADCQAGNSAAFGALVERYQTMVCSIAYACIGDVQASEDVGQETFVYAWNRIDSLREPSRVRAWLAQISRHRAIDSLRQKSRAAKLTTQLSTQTADVVEPSAEQELLVAEESRLMWRTLQRLPPTYREPMVMYYRTGRSLADTARLLGISEDAAKQRLHRGRLLLRDALQEKVYERLLESSPGAAFALGVLALLDNADAAASRDVTMTTTAAASITSQIRLLLGSVGTCVVLFAVVALNGSHSLESTESDAAAGAQRSADFRASDDVVATPKAAGRGAPRSWQSAESTDQGDVTSAAEATSMVGQVVLSNENIPCPYSLVTLLTDDLLTSAANSVGGSVKELGFRGVADREGWIRFTNLPVGVHTLRASCPGEKRSDGGTPFIERVLSLVVAPNMDAQLWRINAPADWSVSSTSRFPGVPGYESPRLGAAEAFESEVPDYLNDHPAAADENNGDRQFSDQEWRIYNNIASKVSETREETNGRFYVYVTDQSSPDGVQLNANLGFATPPNGALTGIQPIEIVALNCPFSAAAHARLDALRRDSPRELGLNVFLYGRSDESRQASQAVCAAAKLGALHGYLDLAFDRIAAGLGDQSREHLLQIARELDLDGQAFVRAMDAKECTNKVAEARVALEAIGVERTPTILVSGKMYIGARDLEFYRGLIHTQPEEINP